MRTVKLDLADRVSTEQHDYTREPGPLNIHLVYDSLAEVADLEAVLADCARFLRSEQGARKLEASYTFLDTSYRTGTPERLADCLRIMHGLGIPERTINAPASLLGGSDELLDALVATRSVHNINVCDALACDRRLLAGLGALLKVAGGTLRASSTAREMAQFLGVADVVGVGIFGRVYEVFEALEQRSHVTTMIVRLVSPASAPFFEALVTGATTSALGVELISTRDYRIDVRRHGRAIVKIYDPPGERGKLLGPGKTGVVIHGSGIYTGFSLDRRIF